METTATPSQVLSLRLERLEKDLQLLTGMQTLIMTDGCSLSSADINHLQGGRAPPQQQQQQHQQDFPERDTNNNPRVSSRESRSNTTKSTSSSTNNSMRRDLLPMEDHHQDGRQQQQQQQSRRINNKCGLGTSTAANSRPTGGTKNNQIIYSPPQTHTPILHHKSTMTEEQDVNPNNNNLQLLKALKREQDMRIDIKESAKIVALKLQQTEEELSRERETKQMLLVGTLQLKNQISGQDLHLKERENELRHLQEEYAMAQRNLSTMTSEGSVLNKKFKDLIYSLKTEKKLLQAENKKMAAEKRAVESQLEETSKQSVLKEQSILAQEQKHVSKLNQMISKCAQVDKERQELAMELRATLEKLENCDQELKQVQQALHQFKSDSERSGLLKDCHLEKLSADMALQKKQFEAQIQSSQATVAKTRSLILQLKEERDELQAALDKHKGETQDSRLKAEETLKNYQTLSKDYDQFKKKIKTNLINYQSSADRLKKENSSLKARVKTLEEEKELQKKLHIEFETEFLKEKTTLEERMKKFETENDHLGSELSRCTDNFRVLQKVSEDQTKTILSLRNEREEQRKLKFTVDTQLREKDANEMTLIRKLDTEQKRVTGLEGAIEEYQKKLSAWEDELREHNCEDYVQTKVQRKLTQIESEVKERYEQWEQSLESAKAERDKATRESHNHQKIAEDTKSQCETRLLEMSQKSKQELQKLKVEMKRSISDKETKIMDLEAAVEQQKIQTHQIQRNLCTKIQQLQCALNAYVTSTTGSTFGAPGLGPISFTNYM